jgi:MFS family permease
MALNSILANTQLQLQAPDELRGRVMGFYSFVVLGMAPFGSLQAGWVAEHFGVRTTFAIGGAICLIATLVVGPRRREARHGDTEAQGRAAASRREEPVPVTPTAARDLVSGAPTSEE